MYIYIYILQMILYFDSVYVAGGVMSFIASLMYLGLCSGFTETMMNDRMGKYLVTLQVLFFSFLCTHRNILQHSATYCNTATHVPHLYVPSKYRVTHQVLFYYKMCTHCNTLQRPATHWAVVGLHRPHDTTSEWSLCCSVMQCVAA